MDSIKKYEKFKSYKTVFYVFLATVVISSVIGASSYPLHPSLISLGEFLGRASADIRLSLIFDLCFLVWIFISGPTIYAPTASFIAVSVYGILWSIRVWEYSGASFCLIAEIIFSALTAYLLVIYSSFVTLTSLRIFTDTKTNDKKELFNGVMFRAERFRGIYNLRYILSYIMFFLVFAVIIGLLSVSKAFIIS